METVYNGDHVDVDEEEEMRLPAGVSKTERRGTSTFKLLSVCTPNGLPIVGYFVELEIIEEAGFFCIINAKAFSGD